MLGLDRPQLVEQRVVDVVADLGIVEHVVAVAVVLELARSSAARAASGALAARDLLGDLLGGGRDQPRQVVASERVEPVAVGEVEVDRGDGDLAGGDRRQVGSGLVALEARVAVDPVQPPAAGLVDERQLVAVHALAERGHLDPVGRAAGDVDVEQRSGRAAARSRARRPAAR